MLITMITIIIKNQQEISITINIFLKNLTLRVLKINVSIDSTTNSITQNNKTNIDNNNNRYK